MIIEVTQSGGFAGLPTAGAQKRVDTSAVQAVESRDAYCEAFHPDTLKNLAERDVSSRAADMFTYHVVVTEDDGTKHEYHLREDQLSPEILDLIDAM